MYIFTDIITKNLSLEIRTIPGLLSFILKSLFQIQDISHKHLVKYNHERPWMILNLEAFTSSHN